MWKIIKKVFNKVSNISIVLTLIFFIFFSILVFIVEGANGRLNALNYVSLLAVILSIPGIINTFADEVNPKKKKFKLTCNCPKCKHLITMSMEEAD